MHRLFIDQNVRLEVGVSLRADGHAVIHASEAGLAERDDETILRWATERGLAVVTFDIDQVLWFSVSGHGFSRSMKGDVKRNISPPTGRRIFPFDSQPP